MAYLFSDWMAGRKIPASFNAADAKPDGWTASQLGTFMLAAPWPMEKLAAFIGWSRGELETFLGLSVALVKGEIDKSFVSRRLSSPRHPTSQSRQRNRRNLWIVR